MTAACTSTAVATVTVRVTSGCVPGQRDAFLALLAQAVQARALAQVPAGDVTPRTGDSEQPS